MRQNSAKRMRKLRQQTPLTEARAPQGLRISTNPSVLSPMLASPLSSASSSQSDTDSPAKSSSRRTTPPPDDALLKNVREAAKRLNNGALDLGNSALMDMVTTF